MAYERLVKRILYVASCECGERSERADNPPKERHCQCGKWVPYVEESYIGPDKFSGRSTP
jgi:hypothetical protein